MKTIYEKYMASPIDKELLCLEHGEITEPYFCYPVNAEPIGFEGCILYCFLPEYGEMVFPATRKAVQIGMYIHWQKISRIFSV